MVDEEKKAVAPDEGKEAETTPETSPVSKEEVSTQTDTAQPSEEIKSQKGEGKSRIERRVEKLEEKRRGITEVLSKLKGQEQISRQNIPPQFIGGDIPLIKPEELEEGIDPQELERRVQARVEKAKNEAIQQAIERMQYQNLIQEHLNEVETAAEKFPELNPKSENYDPDFEQEVVRLYELQNIVYNPLTGQKDFLPVVKLSEVYQQVKAKWDKIKEKGISQTAGKLAEQINSSAVAPSSLKGEPEPSLEDLRRNLWKNPKAVAQRLSKKLPIEE